MTAVINKDLIIYNLTNYLLNAAHEIKKADKETQKRWILKIRHTVHSEYLDPAFNKFYPDSTKAKGVDLETVWEDIRKVSTWNALFILSDIGEVTDKIKENLEEKALVYLMNEFVRGNPIKFKVFPN